MITWGAMSLNDQLRHDWQGAIKINEEDIISDTSSSAPQSILMGGGRRRRTFGASGYISEADYALLEADFDAIARRTLVTNERTMEGYMIDLSMSRKTVAGPAMNGYVSYSATWKEA